MSYIDMKPVVITRAEVAEGLRQVAWAVEQNTARKPGELMLLAEVLREVAASLDALRVAEARQ